MTSNFVSVVIPAYNAALFIREAIESALAQTHRSFEIIVVDDGSTDDTPEIVRKFGKSVRYVRQSNRGLSSARNTAIRNSRGSIIALLDSDDLWDPKYLEVMVEFFEGQPGIGGVYCGHEYINAEGETVGRPITKVVPPDRFLDAQMNVGNWLVPSAVMFHKTLAEEVQLFDESIGPVADTDLWIRMSRLAAFAGLPDVLVKYRCHGGNMSKNPDLMINALRLLSEKMFGPPDGNPLQWSIEKRRSYRDLFWSGVRHYLVSGDFDTSASYCLSLVELSKKTVLGIPFWRSIARAHIPLEYRNDPDRLPDWAQAQEDVFRLLDRVSALTATVPSLERLYPRIRGSALLGLADEAVLQFEWRRAYEWLRQAVQGSPQIVFTRPYWGTIFRSFVHKVRRARYT